MLVSALSAQLERRRVALSLGARHMGWKLGMGARESVGDEIAVGYLTSETVLDPSSAYHPEPGADLHADAEAVVRLGNEVDPRGGARAAAAALDGEPDSVVVANVFHRAVAFAALASSPPADLVVRLSVNGEQRAAGC